MDRRTPHYLQAFYGILICISLSGMLVLPSCGGGGRSAAAIANFTVSPGPGIIYPAGLQPRLTDATTYAPDVNQWYLYDGTAGWAWISAVGSLPGLRATMSNPFEEVAIAVIPTGGYSNAGQINFYVDGALSGSLDMSQATPYTGYDEDNTTFYVIATDLPETMHTVTLEIATGSFAFDGWRIKYKDVYYRIDASDANTLERDTITRAESIRDSIEAYNEDYGFYPNPGTSGVANFLTAQSGDYLDDIPVNPFSGNDMVQSAVYSGGDYNYTYTSATDYSLSIYGGKGTLYTVTPDSVTTEAMSLSLSSPLNHYSTRDDYATVTVTPTSTYESTLTVCCGLSGEISVPATSSAPFTTYVRLAEGVNDIEITLYDAYHNWVTLTRTITRDTTPPEISLIEPHPLVWDGATSTVTVSTATATVEVYVEASATVQIVGMDAVESALSFGLFSAVVDLDTGLNTIVVSATDLLGNLREETFFIIRE